MTALFGAPMSLGRRLVVVAIMLAALLFFGRDVIAAGVIGRVDSILASGDAATALLYTDRALALDPTYPDAAQRLAMIALRSRHTDLRERAVAVASAALPRAPYNRQLRMVQAELLFSVQRYHESSIAWNELAREHPGEVLFRAWAATAANRSGDCEIERQNLSALVRADRHDRRSAARLHELQHGGQSCSAA